MGNACSVEINVDITYVIWIDPEIDNEEFRTYIEELRTYNSLKVDLFNNIEQAIEYMKEITFQETKIIVNGGLYDEFVKSFKENIRHMYFAPKIIVFTSNKEAFIEKNKNYQNNEDKFYKFGGVTNTFNKIKRFLRSELDNLMEIENKPKKFNEIDEINLSVEYIDTKEKLMLPIFFKAIIDEIPNDNNKKFISFLFKTYSNDNDELKKLLYTIEPMTDIPYEILSKYYLRIYSVSSNFHKDVSKNLYLNKSKGLLPYIKTLYEGIKLKSLPLISENQLYCGVAVSDENIKKIKKNIKQKVKHLPSSILFLKSFLSFDKERLTAESNLTQLRKDINFSKVFFILDKKEDIGYHYATFCDMEQLAFFPDQREVIFFPFSTFEVCSIKDVFINRESVYEIRLQFLRRFRKFIETDKNIIETGVALPDSEFKNQICEFGLLKKETVDATNTKDLYEKYKTFEAKIKEK